MMKIAWHWHLHQPPTQKPEVILAINDSCYRPLLVLLQQNSGLRATMSVSRPLVEWWERLGASDIIDSLKVLVGRGQVELVGTGAYHPILTLIPKKEAYRQIMLEERCLGILTDVGRGSARIRENPSSISENPIKGFFSPEMAVSLKLIDTLAELKYEWVLADEVATTAKSNYLELPEQSTKVLIRDRGASLAVAFGHTQTIASFKNMTDHYGRFQDHLVLVMDGETFGHHWPGAMGFLAELTRSPDYKFLTISEVLAGMTAEKVPTITESTWGTSDRDLAAGEIYPKWQLSRSEIHKLQWDLTELALKTVNSSSRELLDQALHSDQYWWGSHNPYWNLEMVERGARLLVETVKASSPAPAVSDLAESLYARVLKRGNELYGDGVIVG